MAFPNQSGTLIRLEFPAIFEVAARDRLLRVSFFCRLASTGGSHHYSGMAQARYGSGVWLWNNRYAQGR